MKIGSVELASPFVVAPMAGMTDSAFRRLVKRHGGCGLVVTEMVSAEGLVRGIDRTLEYAEYTEEERPVSIQIFGGDPQKMAAAAQIVEGMGADIVDVNMGCPVRKVVNSGAGSALLKDFDKAARVVEKIRAAVKIPVTVKVRKGWESNDVLPLLKRFEELGVAAIAIHGRTRNEAYTGASDWEYIRYVKSELTIPVWGNGDVKTPADAVRMFETTKVDGVMIGRAALHNPFIFRDIHNHVAGRTAPENEIDRRIDAMQRYLAKIEAAPQIINWKLHKARTVIGWFSKGIPHGKDIRTGLQDITAVADVQRLLDLARERLAA
jgi:nifR3 family TIM-barrel protein